MLTQSYMTGEGGGQLLYETIGNCLDRIVARYPDNEALVVLHQGVRWNYRQFAAQVLAFLDREDGIVIHRLDADAKLRQPRHQGRRAGRDIGLRRDGGGDLGGAVLRRGLLGVLGHIGSSRSRGRRRV